MFWLTPGHPSEPGVWYAGGSPQGLFRSEDAGDTWAPVAGWNDHRDWPIWAEWPEENTPDGSLLHSVIVDPRDPAHLYLGMSAGGVFESTDRGADWAPLNGGLATVFEPETGPNFFHDPHCIRIHPQQPDRLYQQNHCGIYRIDRPQTTWARIGDAMPREVGDIGFSVEVHPARSRYRVGAADGRHRRVAAHEPRRPAGAVRDAVTADRRGRASTAGSPSGDGSP